MILVDTWQRILETMGSHQLVEMQELLEKGN